jgi:ribosome biogenesis protein BRX1
VLYSPFAFSVQIWVRNYQILEEAAPTAREAREARQSTGRAHATSLVEIGPRFVLDPVRIFRGSFGGQTLWANGAFVTPSAARGAEKRRQGEQYAARKGAQRQRRQHEEGIEVPEDPLADVFR